MRFLAKHGFTNALFDGCMYGLTAEKGPNAGRPIRKPWRVACSPNSSLPKFLNRLCDGSHSHTPCAGSNTVDTQGYTDEICAIVHESIRYNISRGRSAQAQPPMVQLALVAIGAPAEQVGSVTTHSVDCGP